MELPNEVKPDNALTVINVTRENDDANVYASIHTETDAESSTVTGTSCGDELASAEAEHGPETRVSSHTDDINDSAIQSWADALIDAVSEGDVDRVKMFLDAKMGTHVPNHDVKTASMTAYSGHAGRLQLLIDSNVDIAAADENANTALIVAALEGHTVCLQLLLDAKADINIVDKNGDTALFVAAMNGHVECLKLLLEANADIEAKRKDGNTASTLAADGGHTACLQLLLEADADVNAASDGGYTPSILAASKGHTGCLQLLIDAKANIDAVDKAGSTA